MRFQKSKYYFLVLIISFCRFGAVGQQSKIDSLQRLLKANIEDTNKVNNLNELSKVLLDKEEPEKALQFSNSALLLSQKLNYRKGEAKAYAHIAFYHQMKDNYSESLINRLKALKISEEIGDKQEIAWSYLFMGNFYYVQNNFTEALKYYCQASKLSKEIGLKTVIGSSYVCIAVVSHEKGKLAQLKGDTSAANHHYAEALKDHLAGLKKFQELGDKSNMARAYYYIGEMYMYQKKYSSALKNYFAAQKISIEIEDNYGITASCISIGNIYTKQGKHTEALRYLNNDIFLARSYKKKYFLRERYSVLSEVYEKLGEDKKALVYFKLYSSIKDSMSGGDMATKISKIWNQYQNEKEEKIRKLEEEKKEFEHQAQVKQQKIIIYSVSGGFILILALAFFIFRGYKQKQRSNDALAEKNIEIEEKNKDILGSIRYAKRIQTSLLPTEKYIGRVLTEKDKNAGT